MRSLLVVVIVLTVLGTDAAAQPGVAVPAPAAPAATRTQHYGWKTGLVDLAAVGTAVAAMAVFVAQLDMGEDSENGAWASSGTGGAKLAVVAGGMYLLGGPIVHSLHGNSRGAAKSFGVRAGLPLIGFATGVALDREDIGIGLSILGVVGAMLLDDLELAEREVTAQPRATPLVTPTRGGVTLGIAGAF